MRNFFERAFPSSGKIHLSSLDNVRGGSPEKKILSRDIDALEKFAKKWDVPGRGTFYCVSTMAGRRNKENAVETKMVHVDIDLKSVDLPVEEVLARLDALDKPPSRVHNSGHGLHALWVLDQPVKADDRVEVVLKRFARATAGDQMVTQVACLMRLPGTHNSKGGDRLEVTVLRDTGRVWDFEELEDWQVPVIMLARGQVDLGNPYLEAAQEFGFKPPIDVDARLAAMRWRGEGETSVHETQLSVTASLMTRGEAEDAIVARVLQATRDAVGKGIGWNWRREEAAIRGMCRDWAKKHEVPEEPRTNGANGHVDEPKPARVRKKDAHVVLAAGVLKAMADRGEGLVFTRGQAWRYKDDCWGTVPAGELKEFLDRLVEAGCQSLGITSRNSLVSEVRGLIVRNPTLHVEDVPWDGHGKVATRSGLLDVATLKVEPHDRSHWTTQLVDCEWDPGARCPLWLRMLGDAFPADVVDLLQEVMGTFLVRDRSSALRRALVLYGGSYTGKSSVISVMGGFFDRLPIAASLESLEGAHGLMPFLQAKPWVVHEAFEQGRWQFSANAKSLLAANTVSVNIKNGPVVAHEFKHPILWGTNVPPQFRESTKAMQNRLLLVECTRSFEGPPSGVALEAIRAGYSSLSDFVLDKEAAGILRWAVDGWRRVLDRGRFDLPEATAEGMHELWLHSNVVAGFVEECVEFAGGRAVSTMDFCAAFRIWWEENRGDARVPSNQAVGMALKAMGDPRIKIGLKDNMKRYYGGVTLNGKGLDCWQSFSSSRVGLDSGWRLAGSVTEVNCDPPGGVP